MKLRVVQWMNTPEAHAFDEIAALLVATLTDLGHDCDHAINRPDHGRLNIFIGCNLVQDHPALHTFDYIAYQFEQLFADSPWWKMGHLEPILRGAKAVWDYSLQNIEFLGSQGINAQYVPVGFHQSLCRITPSASPEGILFYGSRNPRRDAVLHAVAEKTQAKVLKVFGAYGPNRDALVAGAALNLNMHFYEAKVFEAVRVSYLLNNGCSVVSEDSDPYPYQGVDLPMATAEELPELCRSLLAAGPDTAQRTASRCAEQFRELYPMEKFLREVMGGPVGVAA